MRRGTSFLLLALALVAGLTDRADAVVYFDDGGYHVIDYTITDYVYVDYESPGTCTHVELAEGGTITSHLRPFYDSLITISGGTIGGNLVALDNVQVDITGGTIGQLLWAEEESQITLYGVFDTYGELSAGSPVWDWDNQIFVPSGHLTGTLANGDLIDKDYWIWDNAGITTVVPEPAMLLLLGLGTLMLKRKRG